MSDPRREDSDGWTSAVASGFALVGFLSLVFVAFTLLAMGPFIRYDVVAVVKKLLYSAYQRCAANTKENSRPTE